LIKSAKHRIALTSLYLGSGSKEQELVSSIKAKLSSSDGKLVVNFLFDFTRGSRGENNSRTILLPLIDRYPGNVCLSLFHSPLLRGLRKLIVPERYNEVFSVQHMKIYLVDDTVIISGYVNYKINLNCKH
jgi:CDP-diacylglycerol--glycerol-3-phosphate 3-phosphatidyltransferase